jgi:hypothetical protein
VSLETGLALGPQHAHIAARLALYDPALRLRQSAEPARRRTGHGYILERKTVHTRPFGSEHDLDVRIAARDGYVIISPVHVSFLMREEAIVEQLREGDLAHQTAGQRYQAVVNHIAEEKAARQRARLDTFRGFYRESFDILGRVGDAIGHFEKTRMNNAGLPPAGEIPCPPDSAAASSPRPPTTPSTPVSIAPGPSSTTSAPPAP